ncbi:MAG TPA: hypothetical protein DCY91_31055 [Cyanobacteria bacterium UBA11370]|nr:hypothetical protein [Cyanobacteria bacterium UBA11370]
MDFGFGILDSSFLVQALPLVTEADRKSKLENLQAPFQEWWGKAKIQNRKSKIDWRCGQNWELSRHLVNLTQSVILERMV